MVVSSREVTEPVVYTGELVAPLSGKPDRPKRVLSVCYVQRVAHVGKAPKRRLHQPLGCRDRVPIRQELPPTARDHQVVRPLIL
jgi:hypothetical protein